MEFMRFVLGTILIICFIGIGWLSNEFIDSYKTDREYNGLRFVSNNSHPDAITHAQKYDKYGDWVCINVKGMDYKLAVETCNHEVGHEIFAEYCGKNIDKCINLTK
jgi:hypothetical protein